VKTKGIRKLLILLFLCLDNSHSSEPIEIEDVYTKFICSTGTVGQHTLFVGFDAKGATIFFNKYVFDHEQKKTYELDDGRIPDHAYHVLIGEDRYFLLEQSTRKVAVLAPDGQFLNQLVLDRFEGFSLVEIGELVQVMPSHRPGVAWMTSLKDGKFLLSMLDFADQQSEVVYAEEFSDQEIKSAFWFSNGGLFYQAVPEIGEVRLIDPRTFKVVRVVQKGIEPVEKADNLRLPGESNYEIMLVNPLFHQDGVMFTVNHYMDYRGNRLDRPIQKRLVIRGEESVLDERTTDFLVTRVGEQQLLFDHTEGLFRLE
jgi:hypothetical protein